MTVVGGPLRRLSNWITSLANNANLHCYVYFSHRRDGAMVDLSQKASICRENLRESVADKYPVCMTRCKLFYIFRSFSHS